MKDLCVILFRFQYKIRGLDDYLINPNFTLHAEAIKTDDQKQLLKTIETKSKTLIIFQCSNNSDLTSIVTVAKALSKDIKKSHVKITGFDFTTDWKVQSTLNRVGIMDLLAKDIALKTIDFKFKQWLKSFKPKPLAGPEQSIPFEDRIIFKPPLDIPLDMWFLDNSRKIRLINGVYIISLKGLPPWLGKWTPYKSLATNTWLFVHREPENEFLHKKSFWVFTGKKPQYVIRSREWIFASKAPKLTLITEDKKLIKFEVSNNNFFVSQNTESNKNILSQIYIDHENYTEKKVHALLEKDDSEYSDVEDEDVSKSLDTFLKEKTEGKELESSPTSSDAFPEPYIYSPDINPNTETPELPESQEVSPGIVFDQTPSIDAAHSGKKITAYVEEFKSFVSIIKLNVEEIAISLDPESLHSNMEVGKETTIMIVKNLNGNKSFYNFHAKLYEKFEMAYVGHILAFKNTLPDDKAFLDLLANVTVDDYIDH